MSNRHRFGWLGAVALLTIASPMALAANAPTPDDPTAMFDRVKHGQFAKIGPFLGNLYGEYVSAGGKAAGKSFKSSDPAIRVTNGMVGVDLYADDVAGLARALKSMGATNVSNIGPLFSARIPVGSLRDLAAVPGLRFARPAMATTNRRPSPPPPASQGLVVSQGDVTLRTDVARAAYGVTGAGVPVGILSDSFACNPGAFYPGTPMSTFKDDQASGDLPQDVTIWKDDCPGGTDEGRAMGQIVHDVAPGSPLLFYTAFVSEKDFADGILDLANHGAKVIVDDVGYFAEPMFSDGMIAQAIDIATARGVAYFTSAGNDARDSYESAFRGVEMPTSNGGTLEFHNFGTDPQHPQVLQPITLQPSGGAAYIIVSFQWDQPFKTATTYALEQAGKNTADAKGAESDLDIIFFDDKGHVVNLCPANGVAQGITCQLTGENNIGNDAVDLNLLYYANPQPVAKTFYVALLLRGGPAPGHVKYSVYVAQGGFAIDDSSPDAHSGTAWGHANSATGQGVGAATWYATVPFSTSGEVPPNDIYNSPPIDMSPCNPGCLNDFSSAGNVPIYLDRFGNRLAKPERRYQPSVTGPDGGNSTFFYSDSSYDDDDGNGLNSPFSTFITPLDQPGNEYPNFFGTSAAAPHVAAVAALMLQQNPGLTPATIRAILEQTARPLSLRFISNRPLYTWPIELGPDGYNDDAGHGLVDGYAAVKKARSAKP